MTRPFVALAALAFIVFQAPEPDPVRPDPNLPRPIPAHDTVLMEDMTWMEIRDAMRSGKNTVIVATGGSIQPDATTTAYAILVLDEQPDDA
jgi:hypothetical protein